MLAGLLSVKLRSTSLRGAAVKRAWHRKCTPCRVPVLRARKEKMNKEILKGKWMQVRGDIRSRWGKLTDDEIDQIQGDADKFIGKLQERYGYRREQAEKELNDFLNMPDSQRRRTA